jgi:hypothetical protein
MMFSRIGLIVGGISALIMAGLLGWALRLDHLRAGWRDLAIGITAAIADATETKKLAPKDAAAKAKDLGQERDMWRSNSRAQTVQIVAMAEETKRLEALSEEWRRRAQAAIAKRNDAIQRLADRAIDPGDRADCVAQLREAEASLDLAYEEGL